MTIQFGVVLSGWCSLLWSGDTFGSPLCSGFDVPAQKAEEHCSSIALCKTCSQDLLVKLLQSPKPPSLSSPGIFHKERASNNYFYWRFLQLCGLKPWALTREGPDEAHPYQQVPDCRACPSSSSSPLTAGGWQPWGCKPAQCWKPRAAFRGTWRSQRYQITAKGTLLFLFWTNQSGLSLSPHILVWEEAGVSSCPSLRDRKCRIRS